jgi:sulfite reductase (ferredoxin)
VAKDENAPPITLQTSDASRMSKVDRLKAESEGLFYITGKEKKPFARELDELTEGQIPTISNDAKELSKFFGIYKQQERSETGSKSGDYIFMIRLKLPAGGELSPEQWRALDEAADRFGNGTLRLTTRQGIQFHQVPGRKLGPLIRYLNQEYRDRGVRLTTLGACGDVNRNTMCSPIDDLDPWLPLDSRALASQIASELAPQASAYYQIFLTDDVGRTIAPMTSEEPVYGKHYLPRKFKVGIAHPHDNSIDLLTQDVGLLPVVNGSTAEYYDLYSGGGLGITHNQPKTQQLLGLYLGRIPRGHVVQAMKAIAMLQKENGERKDRRQARWKYTIRRLGLAKVRRELRDRFGLEIKETEPGPIPPVRYFLGWNREVGHPDRFFLGVPVLNGRVLDSDGVRMRAAIRTVVTELGLGVRITPNQDLLLCHVPLDKREWVDRVLTEHGVWTSRGISQVRQLAMACPALPTCGLAMTDAERVLPVYIQALEEEGLGDVDVIIRMAGCPNSCSRPPTAEIGIYGFGKNGHVIQVGGSREGTRVGKILYDKVSEAQMIPVLKGIVRAIRDHKPEGLPAGEFLHETPVDELRRLVEQPADESLPQTPVEQPA